jgi:hypothetical protein
MRPEDELAQGREVEKLYENPMIKQFFIDMDLLLINQLASTELKDVESREKIHGLLQARRSFEQLFRVFIDRGKIVSDDLRQKQDWHKRHKALTS